MRAAIAEGSGGPEVLRLIERPVPRVLVGEVLVWIVAASINRPDISTAPVHLSTVAGRDG